MKTLYCPCCNNPVTILADTNAKELTCPACKQTRDTADYSDEPKQRQQQQRQQQPTTKTVYCPCCNTALTIATDNRQKVFTCPVCRSTNAASKFSETPKRQQQQEHENTGTAGTAQGGKCYRPGCLVLANDADGKWSGDKTISLARGENSIGRMSPNSRSKIQLSTTDLYMSKNHIIIDVIMKSDSTFEHRLSDNGSVNGTFVNDCRIATDEIAILQSGDIIRIGHTSLKFIII